MVNIGMQLLRAANRFPNRTAVVDVAKDVRLTYRELNDKANRLANSLMDLGINKGERVAFLMPNCWQSVVCDAACFKSGLVKVPLNVRLSAQALVHLLNNSEANALIMASEFVESIENVRSEIQTVRHFIASPSPKASLPNLDKLISDGSPKEPKTAVGPDDIYSLFYTSGTSGVLKAAMLTHGNWLSLAQADMTDYVGQDTPGKIVVTGYVAPITHAAGAFLVPTYVKGGCNVLLAKFDVELLMQTIEKEKITDIMLIPLMINMMASTPGIEKYDLSSLDRILYGTAPMAPSVVKKALKAFGPVLAQGYGQTEATAICTRLSREDHITDGDPEKEKRLSSAGLPMFGIEVKIVDEKGEKLPCGEIGEIVMKGGNVMKGYWNAPELTEDTLKDGWLFTRDMGYLDEAGYLFLVDRKSDMIISGGFNIYPREVENVLFDHPAVFEAAVVGIPDDKWGESVLAAVVLNPGMSATEEELIQYCKDHLGSYKKPKVITFVKELPKSPIGKLLRRVVKEPYWKDCNRRVN